MSGIFPRLGAGGLPVRDSDGNPIDQELIENGYVPPSSFEISCSVNYLPSDCTARWEPRQANAIQSEILSLAVRFDPEGLWDCSSPSNLPRLFNNWLASDDFYNSISVSVCSRAGTHNKNNAQARALRMLHCAASGIQASTFGNLADVVLCGYSFQDDGDFDYDQGIITCSESSPVKVRYETVYNAFYIRMGVEQIKNDISDLSNSTSNIELEISQINNRIIQINADISTLQDVTNDLFGRFDDLQDSFNQLQISFSSLVSRVDGLELQLDGKITDIIAGVGVVIDKSDPLNPIISASGTEPVYPVVSVNGKTGAVTVTKADVGLGNVSNLAPASMPVSNATQAALDAKADINSTTNRVPVTQVPHMSGSNGDGYVRITNAIDGREGYLTEFRLFTNGGGGIYHEAAQIIGWGTDGYISVPKAPIANNNIANKKYVDDKVAGLGNVSSVNGKTGAVTLGAGDVGALPSGGTAANSTKFGNLTVAQWDAKIASAAASYPTESGEYPVGTVMLLMRLHNSSWPNNAIASASQCRVPIFDQADKNANMSAISVDRRFNGTVNSGSWKNISGDRILSYGIGLCVRVA